MIKITNLKKAFGKGESYFEALENICLDLPNNGFVAITGDSGSGKTTLLNCISGLEKPTSGTIENVDTSSIGFVFEDFQIIDKLTVKENLILVSEDIGQINEVLDNLGLKKYLNKKANELSGGQKQRLAIARCLLSDSKIVFADEPTGNLDSKNTKNICEILKSVSKNKLVLMVTHNSDLVKVYCDRVIELQDGVIVKDEIINNIVDKDEINKKETPKTLDLKKVFIINKADNKKNYITRAFNVVFSLIVETAIFLGLNTFSNDRRDFVRTMAKELEMNVIDFSKNRDMISFDSDVRAEYEATDQDAFSSMSNRIKNSLVGHKYSFVLDNPLPGVFMYDIRKGYCLTNDETKLNLYNGRNIENENEIVVSMHSVNEICKRYFSPDYTYEAAADYILNKEISINHNVFKIVGVEKTSLNYTNLEVEGALEYFSYFYFNKNKLNDLLTHKNASDLTMQIGNDMPLYSSNIPLNKSDDYSVILGKKAENANEVVIPKSSIINPQDLPSLINKDLTMIVKSELDSRIIRYKSIKIVGISEDSNKLHVSNDEYNLCLEYSKEYYTAIDRQFFGIRKESLVNKNINMLVKNHYFDVTFVSSNVSSLSKNSFYTSTILFFMAVPLSLLLVLFLFLDANQNIKNNKKMIGILKSLNYSNKEVIKIFLLNILFTTSISFILTIAITPLAHLLINNIICKNSVFSFYMMLTYKPWIIAVILLSSLLISLISLLISYSRFNKKSKIDLVYER